MVPMPSSPPVFQQSGEQAAAALDAADPLREYREQFHILPGPDGRPSIYLCGNSLGLMPRATRDAVVQEMDDWARLGVEGHFHAKHPWLLKTQLCDIGKNAWSQVNCDDWAVVRDNGPGCYSKLIPFSSRNRFRSSTT